MNLDWRPVHPPGRTDGLSRIQSSLTTTEAAVLAGLAAGRDVLEVGAGYGFSTVTMGRSARRLVSVDFHEHMPSLAALLANLLEYGLSDRVRVLVEDSKNALPALLAAGERFDLVFVDGDHSTGGVRSDAAWGCRLLRPGGLMAFHDYGEDHCPEVKPTLDSLFKSPVVVYDTLYVVRPEGK